MKHAPVSFCLALCLAQLALACPAAAGPPPPIAPPTPLRMPRPIPRPLPPPVAAPAASDGTVAAPVTPPVAPPPQPLITLPPPPPILAGPPPRRPVRPRRPAPPPRPAGPPPDVKLAIDAPTPRGPWTLRVSNDGSVPVLLAADARLLSIDVTPRGEARPVHCELPADMRPDDDLDRSLVLPSGRSYAETFEPRLYCFGERSLRALAPLAVVVARLGWPATSRSETRQAVTAIDGVEPVVGSLPSLVAPAIALPDEPTPVAAPVTVPGAAPGEPPPLLHLSSSAAVDAATLGELAVTVTLRNDGSRPVRVRFKPETLAFDVTTSRGVERCSWPTPVGAPMRELFSTLPAGGAESLSVMVADYCSRRSFEHAGLVVVRPHLDTRRGGGQDIGLQTFDGQVLATESTVVRLHRGTGSTRLTRPHLAQEP